MIISYVEQINRVFSSNTIPSLPQLDRLLLGLEEEWKRGVKDDALDAFEKAFTTLTSLYVAIEKAPDHVLFLSEAVVQFTDKWNALRIRTTDENRLPHAEECHEIYTLLGRLSLAEASSYEQLITLFMQVYHQAHPKEFKKDYEATQYKLVNLLPLDRFMPIKEELSSQGGREGVLFEAIKTCMDYFRMSPDDSKKKVLDGLTGELAELYAYYQVHADEECPVKKFQEAADTLTALYTHYELIVPGFLDQVHRDFSMKK